LAGIRQTTPSHPKLTSLSELKDNTLLRLLQANSSKIIDENGEPHAVFHQTGADIEIFDTRRQGAGKFDNETPFGIFFKPTDSDIGLAGKKQMPLYVNEKKL